MDAVAGAHDLGHTCLRRLARLRHAANLQITNSTKSLPFNDYDVSVSDMWASKLLGKVYDAWGTMPAAVSPSESFSLRILITTPWYEGNGHLQAIRHEVLDKFEPSCTGITRTILERYKPSCAAQMLLYTHKMYHG